MGNLRNRIAFTFSPNRLHSDLCCSPNVTYMVRVKKTATPCEDLVGLVFIHIRIDSGRQTWLKGVGRKRLKSVLPTQHRTHLSNLTHFAWKSQK